MVRIKKSELRKIVRLCLQQHINLSSMTGDGLAYQAKHAFMKNANKENSATLMMKK